MDGYTTGTDQAANDAPHLANCLGEEATADYGRLKKVI
jgi:hypothetical protein